MTATHKNIQADCELCTQTGDVLWRDERCRIVLVADRDYAGYCRVIWNEHVKEMTDLSDADRAHCMRVVFAVERALRNVLEAHKINLASFGNMAPHVHWHVIPRMRDDAHFPQSIWSARQRETTRNVDSAAATVIKTRVAEELGRLL